MRVLAITISALTVAACTFDPPIEDGEFLCGSGGSCPPGFECSADGRCYRMASGGDADLGMVAPDDLATEDMAVDPTCGAVGQVCCGVSFCRNSACCAAGVCVATGASAGSNLVCSDGTVTACGTPSAACCANNDCGGGCCSGNVCTGSGGTCVVGGTCALGSCGGCGGAAKPCCHGDANGGASNDFCTQADTACDPASSACKPCGGPGQICCEGNFCDNGGCCDHTTLTAAGGCIADGASLGDGSQCVANHGSAGACGGPNQPVCGGKVGCTAPLTRMANGVCVPCGVAGQPCCPAAKRPYCAVPFACNANTGICAVCGGNAQPCCVGAECPNSTQHTCNNGFCH
jgi:hypothetical protein